MAVSMEEGFAVRLGGGSRRRKNRAARSLFLSLSGALLSVVTLGCLSRVGDALVTPGLPLVPASARFVSMSSSWQRVHRRTELGGGREVTDGGRAGGGAIRNWLLRRKLVLASAVLAGRVALGSVAPAHAAASSRAAREWEGEAPPALVVVDNKGYSSPVNEDHAQVRAMMSNPYSDVKNRLVPGWRKALKPKKAFDTDFRPSYETKLLMEKRLMDFKYGRDVYKGANVNVNLEASQSKEVFTLIKTIGMSLGGVALVMAIFRFMSNLALDEEKELYGKVVRVDAIEKPEEEDEGDDGEGDGDGDGGDVSGTPDPFPPSQSSRDQGSLPGSGGAGGGDDDDDLLG